MVINYNHSFRLVDIKDIQESDQRLAIELYSNRILIIGVTTFVLILILTPFCAVALVLQSLNWLEIPLIHIIMKVSALLILWLSLRFIRYTWDISVNHRTSIKFDKASGYMTVIRGSNSKSIPIKNINAIILSRVCQNRNDLQLLLEQIDGVIL